MIISCNECDSSFEVDDSLIKDTGSKVRCSKCNSVFLAYPQTLDADGSDDLGLDDLDSSMAALDDDESFEVEGLTDDLSDELELDLEDFDNAGGEEIGLTDGSDGELDLDLNGEDDSDLDMSEESVIEDELPDLGDFEDLAGLDDDALAMDDEDEDLDDLNLDLEAESEDLDDLDLDLDGQSEADDDLDLTDLGLDDDDELDLTDLDADEETADSDDLDLDFDLDEDDQADEELVEAGAKAEDADELDLSDLELEVGDTSAADDTADAAAEDFDLDLDLEEEPSGGEEVAEAGAKIEEADELDLSDLELELDGTSAADDTVGDASGDLNLDLDLDAEAETIAGDAKDAADELDLSDLEEIIESEESPATAGAAGDAVEDLDLDLVLDGDADAPTAAAGADAEGDNELDLTDLEQMLDTGDAPAANDAGDELDLQFDLDDQSAPAEAESNAGGQDDDLLDIEAMLEQGDEESSDLNTTDEDLSLTMEAALDDAAKSGDDDLELDFDIESELQEKEDLFDSSTPADDALESNLLDTDEDDFLGDTGFDDEPQPADVETDDFATDDFANTQGDFGATDVLPVDDEDIPDTPAVAKPARSRSKKPVLAVFVLLLLAVGVLIIPKSLGINIPYISDIKVPYLSDLDLKIPYLSDWLNPEAQDVAGNLRMMPLGNTISGNFVNTARAGRLFIIRGKIKNEYDHPRSFVKVTGKLYRSDKKLAKKSTVYVGNVISDSELTKMDIAAINKRMKNKFGAKRSNIKIKAGKAVPFMIVFDKLPKNLDEYTVEVASSSI